MKIKIQKEVVNRTIREAFDEFLKYCRVKNLSEKTLLYHNNCFSSFTKFIDSNEKINAISNETIYNYILKLKDEGISTIAINSHLRGIRTFLYYCMRLDYLKEFKIEVIKAEKKIKQVYTDAELKLLLKKPNLKSSNFAEYRSWVIVNYCVATGNRVNSIINIKIGDVDLESGYVTLQKTKNKKQQLVPISNSLSSILSEYLMYRKGEPDDYLFCNSYGTQIADGTIKHTIANYNRKRGVTKTSIHLFRHTYAKKFIQAGGNIFQLQKLLGHSSLEIVKEYVHLYSEDLKVGYERLNPLEQMISGGDYLKLK